MNDNNRSVEDLLGRYRPMGAPPALRKHVLRSIESPQRRIGQKLFYLSAAAMLILSLGLEIAARSITRETAGILYAQSLQWTPEAQEAADLLDGDGRGRQYIALALWADARRPKPFPPTYPTLNAGDNLR